MDRRNRREPAAGCTTWDKGIDSALVHTQWQGEELADETRQIMTSATLQIVVQVKLQVVLVAGAPRDHHVVCVCRVQKADLARILANRGIRTAPDGDGRGQVIRVRERELPASHAVITHTQSSRVYVLR